MHSDQIRNRTCRSWSSQLMTFVECKSRRGSIMSKNVLYALLACALVVRTVSAQQQSVPENSRAEATPSGHKITLNGAHLTNSGFRLSAFIETGSTSDLCLVTYNTSTWVEGLAPILCEATEYHGRRGIRLLSYLPAHPPDNFVVVLTVYQQDARRYAVPIRCDVR